MVNMISLSVKGEMKAAITDRVLGNFTYIEFDINPSTVDVEFRLGNRINIEICTFFHHLLRPPNQH